MTVVTVHLPNDANDWSGISAAVDTPSTVGAFTQLPPYHTNKLDEDNAWHPFQPELYAGRSTRAVGLSATAGSILVGGINCALGSDAL